MSAVPYCVKCARGMRCKENSVFVTDAPPNKPVKDEDGRDWEWGSSGDLYECEECGIQIVTGFSKFALVRVDSISGIIFRRKLM